MVNHEVNVEWRRYGKRSQQARLRFYINAIHVLDESGRVEDDGAWIEINPDGIGNGEAYIELVWVAKEYRNKGYAKLLMRAVCAWADAYDSGVGRGLILNLTVASLDERCMNDGHLHRFYRQFGFESVHPDWSDMHRDVGATVLYNVYTSVIDKRSIT